MAKAKGRFNIDTSTPKKTSQGDGRFTKTPAAGGESFGNGHRSGSPPNKARRRKKPYKGQGR